MTAPVVFVSSRAGTRYHAFPGCSGLNATERAGDPIHEITVPQAGARGLTPCAHCQPRPTLTVVQGGTP